MKVKPIPSIKKQLKDNRLNVLLYRADGEWHVDKYPFSNVLCLRQDCVESTSNYVDRWLKKWCKIDVQEWKLEPYWIYLSNINK